MGLLTFLDSLPRNSTPWGTRKVSKNGDLLYFIAHQQAVHRNAARDRLRQEEDAIIQEIDEVLQGRELDQELLQYVPKTRHNATEPTVGTRRKISSFFGNVVGLLIKS
jgi:hypothetical protein